MRAAHQAAVLLIIYNRPEKTRNMISVLRNAKPTELFVAADGPRQDKPDDVERCADSRLALDEIDWPCVVHRLFQDDNLGCKIGPETAITWFFSHVRAGIILEDDCVPTPDFFPFCAELLDRFNENERVMMISGYNQLGAWSGTTASYGFSRTSPTWGWATWRRAWRHYDPRMTDWTSSESQRAVKGRMPVAEFRMTQRRFDQVHSGELDAWDFAWAFAMLRTGGLSVVPTHNLIRNIGFDHDATHTKNRWSADARVSTAPLSFPLSHPARLEPTSEHEHALFARRFPISRRVMLLLPASFGSCIRAAAYRVMLPMTGRSNPSNNSQRDSRISDTAPSVGTREGHE